MKFANSSDFEKKIIYPSATDFWKEVLRYRPLTTKSMFHLEYYPFYGEKLLFNLYQDGIWELISGDDTPETHKFLAKIAKSYQVLSNAFEVIRKME